MDSIDTIIKICQLIVERLKHVNAQTLQVSVPDTKHVENPPGTSVECQMFYLKRNPEVEDGLNTKLDDSGNPIVYAACGDSFYRVLRYDINGKPQIDFDNPTTMDSIMTNNDGYKLEQRQIFATVQYDIGEMLFGDSSVVNFTVNKSNAKSIIQCIRNIVFSQSNPPARVNTADHDQLSVAITGATVGFAADERVTEMGFFNESDGGIVGSLKTVGSDGCSIEDVYSSTYFCVNTDSIKVGYRDRISRLEEERAKKLGEFEKDSDDVEKEIELLRVENELFRLKAMGAAHITTEVLVRETGGVVNHGPEIYHFYPEPISGEDRFVTVVPGRFR
jgi:hypothetical protein